MADLASVRRLDSRMKWALRGEPVTTLGNVDSQERLLESSNSPTATALRDRTEALYGILEAENPLAWLSSPRPTTWPDYRARSSASMRSIRFATL